MEDRQSRLSPEQRIIKQLFFESQDDVFDVYCIAHASKSRPY